MPIVTFKVTVTEVVFRFVHDEALEAFRLVTGRQLNFLTESKAADLVAAIQVPAQGPFGWDFVPLRKR